MRRILFLLSAILLFSAFSGLFTTNPIVTESVTLDDNGIYPKWYKPSSRQSNNEYYTPYRWAKELDISKSDLSNEIPILLRSMETNKFSFDNLREYILLNISDLSFPIYYERAGLNQDWSKKLSYKHNEGDFIDYSKIIFSDKDGRTELFNYGLKSFEKIEKYFPNTWKNYYLSVVDNCIVFTKNYAANRGKYKAIEEKSSLVNEEGQYNAFIYRRIEHDKVPIQEINSYLNKLKFLLEKSVNSESKSNYKNVVINNGSIVLSDNSVNSYDGAQVKIWNETSEKSLTFSWFSHLKYLKNNGKNYYIIYYDGKNSLIDENLNIIRTAESKQ